MPKVNVKGQEWDIKSVDGNTVTLANGEEIEVNDDTLGLIKKGNRRLSK